MDDRPDREATLRSIVRGYGSAVVAFSGGVDSSVVAAIAADELGEQAVAVTSTAPTYPAWDARDAERVVERIGIEHRTLATGELDTAAVRTNPPDRCYHCKRQRLREFDALRRDLGFAKLLDGTNADDGDAHRPGMRAVEEFGDQVASPLAEAGFGTAEIRDLAERLGLPTAHKPSSSCLATRIPYGTPITDAALERIERAEAYLHSLGFDVVRVRDYGDTARIEVAPERVTDAVGRREEIATRLTDLGYTFVTLDLAGYRTGSMDAARS